MGRTTAVSKQILNGEGGAAIVVMHFAQRNVLQFCDNQDG